MNPPKKTPNKIFFLGIGGSGMSGLAEVLFNLGYEVSGSDLIDSSVTKRLKSLGIEVRIGHEVNNVNNQDMIIKSRENHQKWHQQMIKNNQFLEEVMKTDIYAKLENHIKTP